MKVLRFIFIGALVALIMFPSCKKEDLPLINPPGEVENIRLIGAVSLPEGIDINDIRILVGTQEAEVSDVQFRTGQTSYFEAFITGEQTRTISVIHLATDEVILCGNSANVIDDQIIVDVETTVVQLLLLNPLFASFKLLEDASTFDLIQSLPSYNLLVDQVIQSVQNQQSLAGLNPLTVSALMGELSDALTVGFEPLEENGVGLVDPAVSLQSTSFAIENKLMRWVKVYVDGIIGTDTVNIQNYPVMPSPDVSLLDIIRGEVDICERSGQEEVSSAEFDEILIKVYGAGFKNFPGFDLSDPDLMRGLEPFISELVVDYAWPLFNIISGLGESTIPDDNGEIITMIVGNVISALIENGSSLFDDMTLHIQAEDHGGLFYNVFVELPYEIILVDENLELFTRLAKNSLSEATYTTIASKIIYPLHLAQSVYLSANLSKDIYYKSIALDEAAWLTSFSINPHYYVATSIFNTDTGLPSHNIRDIYFSPSADMWISTWGGGVVKYNNGTFDILNNLPNNLIGDVNISSQNQLWIGTWGDGIVLWENNQIINLLTEEDGLPHGRIDRIEFAPNGTPWIGTWGGGLAKIQADTFAVYNNEQLGGSDFYLHDNFINDIVFLENGDTYVALGSSGLAKWNGTSFDHFNTTSHPSLPDDVIRDIAISPSGEMWIGTWNGGIARWTGTVATDPKNSETTNLPADAHVEKIAFSPQGNLWLGLSTGAGGQSSGGLARLLEDGYSFRLYNTANSNLPSDLIIDIEFDANGDMWLATDNGLVKVEL